MKQSAKSLRESSAEPDPRAPRVASELLSLRERRRLVRDIVVTRAHELRLAYPDIRAVNFGYRVRNARQRSEWLLDAEEPCVVFLIDRKYATVEIEEHRLLPPSLLAMATLRGRQMLVSIPIDVQELGFYQGAEPHGSPDQIASFSGTSGPEIGQVCCPIRIRDVRTKIFVIGCLHVFMPRDARQRGELAAKIFLADADTSVPDLGVTVPAYSGDIHGGSANDAPSFDAQLAEVDDETVLHAALGDISLTDSITQTPDVPSTFFVQTSRGPIEVTKVGFIGPEVEIIYDRDITGAGGTPVRHAELLVSRYKIDSALAAGDSGSPVTSQKDGGLLVGMHIAGNKDNGLAYAIPAWRLLDSSNYTGLSREKWTIVKASELKPAIAIGSAPVSAPPVGL
jgi:hypothetical protein